MCGWTNTAPANRIWPEEHRGTGVVMVYLPFLGAKQTITVMTARQLPHIPRNSSTHRERRQLTACPRTRLFRRLLVSQSGKSGKG